MRFLAALGILCLTVAPALAQRGDRRGETQAPVVTVDAPPAPALSPEEALKTFVIADGFRLELIAAEPLVQDPVAITFDPDGRIWVVEMSGFMPNLDGVGENEPVGKIVVLDDRDADGVMDHRTVFLDGLVLPRAIGLAGDGVLVAEPPHLWFCRDTDGDGVADEKKEIASDYGNPRNPEHSANGLFRAMDNWIHSANHTARYRHERGEWRRETVPSRGQWGIGQDDAGRLFYNNNSDPLRADLVPADDLHRNPHLTGARGDEVSLADDKSTWPVRVTPGINRGYRTLRPDGTLPSVTAACGPAIYRGDLFPAEFLGNAFVPEPAGNLVKRLVLTAHEDGALSAKNAYEEREFLASTDERFRPVNATTGPDGALYLVDMYRGVIQHRMYVTTYLRNQVLERGLEQPLHHGRIYRLAPAGAPPRARPGLSKADTAQLLALLAHPNGWQRDTAQRLLVERRDPAAEPRLREIVRTAKSPLARLHALWTLEGFGALEPATLAQAIDDADPRVRAAAVRLAPRLGGESVERFAAAVIARTRDDDARVRLHAALALGDWRTPAAERAMREMLRAYPAQPYLADAIASGLSGRELEFASGLIASGGEISPGEEWTRAVELLASCVLRENQAARMQRLLALLAGENQPAWAREALLAGIERFVPRRSRGGWVETKIAAEPTGLLTVAQRPDDPLAERAAQLAAVLTWPDRGNGRHPPEARPLTAAEQTRFVKGRENYTVYCAPCHQPTGEGVAGLSKPLVGSRWVVGSDRVLARIVLNGKTSGTLMMPPMRALDDETLASVLTYIRREWGHQADPVSPTTISRAREATAARDEAWTDEELAELTAERREER